MSTKPRTVREWFESSLAHPTDERASYLHAECLDFAIRNRVERMLKAHADEDSGLLGLPIAQISDRLSRRSGSVQPESHWIGKEIGGFVLKELLGEGGSAVVYRGERATQGVTQSVAVKIFRQMLLTDTEQHRFTSERRALSQLTHPNIARLIDGGTTDSGIAFIVLELVDGKRLTDYVNTRHLRFRDRIRLMIEICRTVEAAHRALIVHRDLKPSNILVTSEGHIKLLDFGIAKFLSSVADQTEAGRNALTPAYAAPEQFGGQLITTATDVYSLGVLLGEVLTGRRFSGETNDVPSRHISAHTDETTLPDAPKAVRRQLRGDIDNIILKALDHEANRRYASAGAMADDLDNYLRARPVQAHAPSRWYRMRKFAQRNAGSVSLALAAAIGVLISLGVALWQAREAREQAQRAVAVSDFMISIFDAAQADIPKELRPTTEDLVRSASNRVVANNNLSDGTRADLFLALGAAAERLHDDELLANLLDRMQPLVDRLYAVDDPQWLKARLLHSNLMIRERKFNESAAILEPLESRMFSRFDKTHVDGLLQLVQATLGSQGQPEALALSTKIREWAVSQADQNPELTFSILVADANLLTFTQRFSEGLEHSEQALAFWKNSGLPPSSVVLWLQETIGNAASSLGDNVRGEKAYRAAVALAEELDEKPNKDKAWMIGLLGSFLLTENRLEEAEPYVQRGLEMRVALLGEQHPESLFATHAMARLRSQQGRFDEAVALADRPISLCSAAESPTTACAKLLGWRARELAKHQLRFDDADHDIQQALLLQRRIAGDDGPQIQYLTAIQTEIYEREGNHQQALEISDETLAMLAAIGGGHWQVELQLHLWRAHALYSLGRAQDALDELLMINLEPADSTLRFDVSSLHAKLLASLGRKDEAIAMARTALALGEQRLDLSSFEIEEIRAISTGLYKEKQR